MPPVKVVPIKGGDNESKLEKIKKYIVNPKIRLAIFVVLILIATLVYFLFFHKKTSSFLPSKYGERSDLGEKKEFSMVKVFRKLKKRQDDFLNNKK